MRFRVIAAVAAVLALAWGVVYAGHTVIRKVQSFASQLEYVSLPWHDVGSEEKRFEATDLRGLVIRNGLGDVTVVAGGPEVRVEVAKRARGTEPADARVRAKGLTVSYSRDRKGWLVIAGRSEGESLNTSLDFVIQAPARMGVRIDAGAGELAVKGMDGPVTVTADAGEIVVEGATAPVEVSARAGEIQLRDLRGDRVRARLDIGEIGIHLAEPFSGEARAHTRIGEVTVALTSGSRCRVQTNAVLGSISDGLPGRVVAREGPGMIEAGVGIGEVSIVEAD